MPAQHEQVLPVGQLAAGSGSPLALDLAQPFLRPHVMIGANQLGHVGFGAVLRGVAHQDRLAKRIHAVRHIHRVAGIAQCAQCVEQ